MWHTWAVSLSPIIRALQSLIEELDGSSGSEDSSERRRYYRLTSAGLKLVRAEVAALAQTLRVARAKRILRGADV